ncbi:hypothetical protein [Lachnoclostridium phytofermentans]|uniref:Uncharacterized protein n=1 Tax=Lachnoclostridium phytofermentans (strain ATCC 700394 / DSM 18823 / ISDg) TaxID=357809 RepID=A9KKQ1_LACP7|nr:hypothetical protein [Lachnoclostridium phytofermentans]ABX41222.1 hypothetical protein Cphy_0835 [Lachnoclostridium phytofermentans ISDg]
MIAFVGNESSDIMLYLAITLKQQNRRVLILDETKRETIPCFLEEGNTTDQYEVVKNSIEQHREIDYLSGHRFSSFDASCLEKLKEDYDDIFLRVERNYDETWTAHCKSILFLSDLQKDSIEYLKIISEIRQPDIIMLRNIINCKIKPKYVLLQLRKKEKETKVILVPYRNKDRRYQIENQYNNRVRFNQLSSKLRRGILEILCFLVPELDKRKIKKAFEVAGKGI